MIARNMHCCAVGKVHGAMSFLGLVVFFTSFGKRLCRQAPPRMCYVTTFRIIQYGEIP